MGSYGNYVKHWINIFKSKNPSRHRKDRTVTMTGVNHSHNKWGKLGALYFLSIVLGKIPSKMGKTKPETLKGLRNSKWCPVRKSKKKTE